MAPPIPAAIVVFFQGLSLWCVIPVLPFFTQSLGGSPTAIGVMFALMTLPKPLLTPLAGRLADRWGRKPLLVITLIGTILASVAWALSDNLLILGASRLLWGLFGLQAGICQSVVADSTADNKRASGMALLGVGFALSMTVGPVLGGYVAEVGIYATVGWVMAALQTAALLTVLMLLPETNPRQAHATRGPAAPTLGPPQNRRLVVALLGITLLTMIAFQQFIVSGATYLERSFAFGPREVGYVFAGFGLIGALVQGGIVRRFASHTGEAALALLGAVCFATGAAGLALSPASLIVAALFAGLVAAGGALFTPTVAALLSRAGDPRSQGALLGLQQGIISLGRGIGSGIGGLLFDVSGALGTYLGAALLALISALLLGTLLVPRPTAIDKAPADSDADPARPDAVAADA